MTNDLQDIEFPKQAHLNNRTYHEGLPEILNFQIFILYVFTENILHFLSKHHCDNFATLGKEKES